MKDTWTRLWPEGRARRLSLNNFTSRSARSTKIITWSRTTRMPSDHRSPIGICTGRGHVLTHGIRLENRLVSFNVGSEYDRAPPFNTREGNRLRIYLFRHLGSGRMETKRRGFLGLVCLEMHVSYSEMTPPPRVRSRAGI